MTMTRAQKIALFCTASYLVLIYTTSGYMPVILAFLKKHLNQGFSTFCTVLMGLVLIGLIGRWQSRLRKTSKLKQMTFCLTIIGYILAIKILSIPEERIHLLQYGLLTYGVMSCFTSPKQRWKTHFITLGVIIFAGMGDEFIQHLRPNRYGDVRDVIINAASGLLAQGLFFSTNDPA